MPHYPVPHPNYTEDEIAAVRGVRPKFGRFEAVVSHPALEKKQVSQCWTDERDARVWKLETLRELNSGKLAAAAQGQEVSRATARRLRRPTHLSLLFKQFLDAPRTETGLKPFGRRQVEQLRRERRLDIPVDRISYAWALQWIDSYKAGDDRLTPDSIKKKKQALERVLDWYYSEYWVKAELEPPTNPLSRLPKSYATYDAGDPNRMENQQRDRRLFPGEEQKITDVITGKLMRRCRRPVGSPVETLMAWRLIVNTGLRLREMYRLRMRAVNLGDGVLTVERSKSTKDDDKVAGRRYIPMTDELHAQLRSYVETKNLREGSDDLLFPWWPGETGNYEGNERVLRDTTTKLSKMFRAIHKDAGCTDLREHDLRHEATSRWCEMRWPDGRPMYSQLQVMSFTGHTEEATFRRYLHFFARDLTPRALRAAYESQRAAAANEETRAA